MLWSMLLSLRNLMRLERMIADGDGLSKMQWAQHLLIITLGKPWRFFIGVIVIMKSILSYVKAKKYWASK